MKTSLLFVAFAIASSLYAQKSEVFEKFEEYHFSEKFLTQSLKDFDAGHSFDAKITTVNSTETKIETAKFDPTKEVGQRWILVSVNDTEPTKKEIKQFNKSFNTTQPQVNGRVDESSWFIESDNDEYLVVSFKFEQSSLPKKYAFLGACKGFAYFNKQTKTLEKAEFVNAQPLKIKIFNVTHLDMIVTYKYFEDESIYLIEKEDLRMEVKLLGQLVNVNDITVFSNFKKK